MHEETNTELKVALDGELKKLIDSYGIANIRQSLAEFELKEKSTQESQIPAADSVVSDIQTPEDRISIPNNQKPEVKVKSELEKMDSLDLLDSLQANMKLHNTELREDEVDTFNRYIKNALMIINGPKEEIDVNYIEHCVLVPVFLDHDWFKEYHSVIRERLKEKLATHGYIFYDDKLVGTVFDPDFERCDSREPAPNAKSNMEVVRVIRDGYGFEGRIELPASVILPQ